VKKLFIFFTVLKTVKKSKNSEFLFFSSLFFSVKKRFKKQNSQCVLL
jgi:hypothetical protein